MLQSYRREIGLAAAWLLFPIVPVFLEDLYYQIGNLAGSSRFGPDPHEWGWIDWVIMLGPLAGFSFLAGVTQDVPDNPESLRRGLGRFFAHRAVWVAVGPWGGLLILIGSYFAIGLLGRTDSDCADTEFGGARRANFGRSDPGLGSHRGCCGNSGLWMVVAGMGGLAASREDSSRGSCALPRSRHDANLHRVALRRVLGDHLSVAKLLLRLSSRALDRPLRRFGRALRVRFTNELWPTATARIVPRDAACLGVRSRRDVALVGPAPAWTAARLNRQLSAMAQGTAQEELSFSRRTSG